MSRLVIIFFAIVFIAFATSDPSVCFVNQQGGTGCYNNIKSALAQIPNGGTINLSAGLYQGSSNVGVSLSSGSYVINGAGSAYTIIDCEYLSSGFNLYSGTFILSNLTLKHCVGINGGALTTTSTSFSIYNVVFTNNEAVNGGAIYSTSNSLALYNVLFANNYASNQGGAMYLSSVSTQLFQGVFNNNNTAKVSGDVIYCTSASINIDSSTVIPIDSVCLSCPVTIVSTLSRFDKPAITTRQNACVANPGQSSSPQSSNPPQTSNNGNGNGPAAIANSCSGCCYRFTQPTIPSFNLPAALGTDTQLNVGNPIMLSDGSQINAGQGCNGDVAEYQLPTGEWTSTYTDANGNQQTVINIFYTTAQNALMVRTIQSWQSNIEQVLTGRPVRLWITCNNGRTSCLNFVIRGLNSSCSGVENKCFFSPSNSPSATFTPQGSLTGPTYVTDSLTAAAAATGGNTGRSKVHHMGQPSSAAAFSSCFVAILVLLALLF